MPLEQPLPWSSSRTSLFLVTTVTAVLHLCGFSKIPFHRRGPSEGGRPHHPTVPRPAPVQCHCVGACWGTWNGSGLPSACGPAGLAHDGVAVAKRRGCEALPSESVNQSLDVVRDVTPPQPCGGTTSPRPSQLAAPRWWEAWLLFGPLHTQRKVTSPNPGSHSPCSACPLAQLAPGSRRTDRSVLRPWAAGARQGGLWAPFARCPWIWMP